MDKKENKRMRIISIILKSGLKIDVSEAEKIEAIAREEVKIQYKGFGLGDDIRWEPAPIKVVNNYLSIYKDNKTWEIKESEIAAFEYSEQKENENSLKI